MYRKVYMALLYEAAEIQKECLWRFYFGILCIKLKSPEIVEEIELYSVSKSANSVSKLNIENIVTKIKFSLRHGDFFAQITADYDICYYSYQIAKKVLKIKL